MTTYKAEPPPTYYHRCFLMAHAPSRQFFDHARFDPAAPPLEKEACRKLIRAVVARESA